MCHNNIFTFIFLLKRNCFLWFNINVYGKVHKVIDLKYNKHVNKTDPIDVMLYRVHLSINGTGTLDMQNTTHIDIRICFRNIYSKPTTEYTNPKIRVMTNTISKNTNVLKTKEQKTNKANSHKHQKWHLIIRRRLLTTCKSWVYISNSHS